MFGIGIQEMLIILVVVLIFFGPKRLPDLARSLGTGIAEFKKASDEVRRGIDEAVREEEAASGGREGGPSAGGADGGEAKPGEGSGAGDERGAARGADPYPPAGPPEGQSKEPRPG